MVRMGLWVMFDKTRLFISSNQEAVLNFVLGALFFARLFSVVGATVDFVFAAEEPDVYSYEHSTKVLAPLARVTTRCLRVLARLLSSVIRSESDCAPNGALKIDKILWL
jgi:hypothetical protein